MEHLLNDPKFQKKLKAIADQRQESLDQVVEEAKKCLNEMYTVHQPIANVMGTQAAQYILARGYQKTIDVNPTEIKELTKLARRYSIAFVMTHKTYIDMFVLAVVLGRHGLPFPYTFAGNNMNFLGLGQLGRQTGVIFIRRSFKDDLVYKATLRHFIAHIVEEKASFMWAIEGTRSRTGKLVWPKMGILKYIKDAETDTQKEVKYIPVSIVYDLIPDVKEMTEEGRGNTKNPESLGWFIDYVKKMGDNFGKISLRFGQPVEVSQNPIVAVPDNREQFMSVNGMIPRFALELVHRINQITPVTTASLICVSLLGKYALSKRAIESDLANLMQLIEGHKPDALVDRGKAIGESVQTALNLLRRAKLVIQQGDDLNAKFVIASDNYLSTTYYANMAIHHLYHRAFIEMAILKMADCPVDERSVVFWSDIMHLRNLFKFEFFYSRKDQFSNEIETNLKAIDDKWAANIHKRKTDPEKILSEQKVLVAPVVLNTFVEAYRVVIHALQNWDPHRPFNEDAFINTCLYLGEEMQWQGRIQRIESVSKPFLLNGLRLAKHLRLLPDEKGRKDKPLARFLKELVEVADRINKLQGIILARSRENASIVPIERDIVPGSKTESITSDILEGESGPHIGAFFDLDRTIIKGFSAKEFFQTRLLSGRITTREVVAQFAGVIVYAMGNGNFAGLAAVGAKGVKGVKEQLFIQVGEEVYQKHLAKEIYPESRALVAAHMAKGHTVAIISAATPYQVNSIARDLGVEHVMCTRMEVENGVFTGNIVEPACWGDGKAHAAKELTEQYNLDLSKSYFYTDSHEDLPLMEIVGNPRPLNPDTKLSAVAFQNDWPIFRFNDDERPGVSNLVRTGLAISSLVPAVLTGVASGTRNLSWQEGINSLMASIGDLVINMAGIQLVVKGEKHLWTERPGVFIINHQSNVDPFIAAKLIRKDAVGIAKKELKNMPIIGQIFTAAGVIFLDRKNREKAIEAMKPAVDVLKNGTSIIIFPEGTRSYDYALGPFKKGAFHLAMQAEVPLIPIIIKNAHDAMPRGASLFRPTAVEVVVLPPIPTTDWKKSELTERIAKVRNLFLRELGQEEESIEAILNHQKN